MSAKITFMSGIGKLSVMVFVFVNSHLPIGTKLWGLLLG
jgi:hypothetical protein